MMAAGAPTGLGRRLVANTLHAASGRVAAMVVWIVFTPPILRTLGAEGFAVWSLFFALTGYLAALDFGLVQGTMRHVAGARERGRHDEAGAHATLGLLGYLALSLVWLAVVALAREPVLAWLRIPPATIGMARFAMLAGAGVFALAGVANVCLATMQAYGRFDRANGILLAMTLLQALVFALALHGHWGFIGLVAGVALAWATGALMGAALLTWAVPAFRWGSPVAAIVHVREALRFGAPMQFTSTLAAFNVHLDKLLLSRFVGLAAVAPYELGSRVSTVASSLPQLMLLAVLPEASAMHAIGDNARTRQLYDRGSRYLMSGVTVIVGPLIGVGARLFEVWLGPGHGEAVLVLRALAVSGWVSLATGMGTTVARAAGRTDLEAWFATIAVGLHLALSVLLLPRIGMPGALLAITAGVLIGALVFAVQLARLMHWSLSTVLSPWVVPALATLVAASAGAALDRLLPGGHGTTAWLALLTCAVGAGAAGLTTLVILRYLPWREALALLTTRGNVAREPL